MHLPVYLEVPLRLAMLVAGLLLPGSMLLRALRLPWSLAAAFATSTAALYAVVLVFAWTGAVISLTTLAAGLALIAVLAGLVPVRAPSTQISSSFASFTQMGWWLPLYLAFWLVVGWRLVLEPLPGPDTNFRWGWLAEQMLAAGNLDFYPPRSGADFVRYFWAESIPPGVAGLNAWAYACGGGNNPLWTAPVAALQLLAIHELIWRLGSRWGGEVVARRAVLFAAACPLLTWSATLGQETGLTALAVAGLVWSLSHLPDEDGDRWAVLAALFSIVAASAREYGPIFPLVAIVATVWLKAPRRQTLLFAAIALPVVLAWPLRVWILTGNPIHSLGVAGIFPTNEVFTTWNNLLRGPSSEPLATIAGWLHLGRYLLLWGLPAVAGLAALAMLLVQQLREARLVAVFVVLVALLWVVSVGYTAGGLFYSLRVLSPVFALMCVTASYGIALLPQSRWLNRVAAAGVALVLLESLPKTLVLPENPYRSSPRDWLYASQLIPRHAHSQGVELLAAVQPLPDRKRILSDYTGAPRLFASIGSEVAPLWSNEVEWLFNARLQPEEIAARWRKSGLRYIVLLKTGPTAVFMQNHARWRAPHFQLRTVAELPTLIVLEATAPAPPAAPAASPRK